LKIDDLLSRADDETLQALLDGPALRLIMLLDPGWATPSQLRRLVIDLHTPHGLLKSSESRSLLFDLLKPKEAKALARILEISENSADTYRYIKSCRLRQGSEREKALFDFFELVPPQAGIEQETPAVEEASCGYPLFEHQRRAVRQVQQALLEARRRVVLHMPTGAGKTRTAMNVIAEHLREKEPSVVVWLAHSEELCEQAASEFLRAWAYLGNRKINLYRFWGNRQIDAEQVQDGLIVAGLSKLYNAARSRIQIISTLGRKTSLVIMDEAHSAVADTYRLILDALVVHHPTTGLLGLTATPGRTWVDIDIDKELADFFDRRKVTLQIPGYQNPVNFLVAQGYLASVDYRPLFYDGGMELTEQDLRRIRESLDIPDSILKQLAEDEKRNLKIVTEIETLANRHRRILVFAATTGHSNLLATVLRARGYHAYSVLGSTPSREREHIIKCYMQDSSDVRIICNYGVLTTGFDAPRTSAAVIARPTKSLVLYSQMIGRAIRGPKAGGNESAEIVTIVDYNLPGFRNIADAFNHWEDIWE